MVIQFEAVLQELRTQRDRLNLAIDTLEQVGPPQHSAAAGAEYKHNPKSAATRAKMSRSQRKRWAAIKRAA